MLDAYYLFSTNTKILVLNNYHLIFKSGRKLSPTPPTNRLAIEAPNEKDEGISDEEDPAELRILLELNEQVIFFLKNTILD